MRSWSEGAHVAWWRACVLGGAIALAACGAPPPAATDAGPPVEHAGAADDAGSCVPSCEVCGVADGCGGMCPPCAEQCSCEGRVCGDDGCGNACGACGGDETCSADGARCDCGDAVVVYRVRAPEVDWGTTGRIDVTLRQRFAREAGPQEWRVSIDRFTPEVDVLIEGACSPEIEVRWSYVSRYRDRLGRRLYCDGGEWALTGETAIDLPAGTGGACRAL